MPLRTDVTRKADVEALVSTATDALGGLDFAFNNPGILRIVKPEQLSEQDGHAELDVDLTGVFLCCQAA